MGYNEDLYGTHEEATVSTHGLAIIAILGAVSIPDVYLYMYFTVTIVTWHPRSRCVSYYANESSRIRDVPLYKEAMQTT